MRNQISSIIVVTALLVVIAPRISRAQSDDSDFQSWNDLQVTTKLTSKLDLLTTGTVQFHSNLSKLDNTRFAIGVIAKPTKRFSITPFVTFISDRDSHNNFRYEYRLNLRAVYKFSFEHVGISHRSQFEYRFRPGSNTWRYRPSITVERSLPKSFVPGLKLFVTEEPFYDSGSGYFSRNRLSAGINKSLNRKLSLDVYFLHQGDNHSRPGTVNVIGTTLKLSL